MMIRFVCFSIVLHLLHVVMAQMPTVTLEYATIQAAVYNETGDFYVYKNVRFAAPPVGNLRFQPRQPPLVETEANNGSAAGNCSTQED